MSGEESKIARERDLIFKAVEAQKAAERKPEATGSTAVTASGGKAEKTASAGPVPSPKNRTFTAHVTDPTQVQGAMDNLQK